jgi:DNA mismatch endonuclease (patch repair protein)
MDRLSAAQRSENMRRIKSKDSSGELAVRRLVHGLGYRYRLHDQQLPGRPDMVFPGRRKIIFMHGCFWHQHRCSLAHTPRSRTDYWKPKLERNRARDREHRRTLKALGWEVLVIWECEIRNLTALTHRLKRFFAAS